MLTFPGNISLNNPRPRRPHWAKRRKIILRRRRHRCLTRFHEFICTQWHGSHDATNAWRYFGQNKCFVDAKLSLRGHWHLGSPCTVTCFSWHKSNYTAFKGANNADCVSANIPRNDCAVDHCLKSFQEAFQEKLLSGWMTVSKEPSRLDRSG